MKKPKHKDLVKWVEQMAKLCKPDRVVWLDGSLTEKKKLEKEALKSGELIELNKKKLPGCFLHRSDPNDVARIEHLTYICTKNKNDAGPTNNWMSPKQAYGRAKKLFDGAMRGRTMYVIPFSMGTLGSPFSKIGIQLTDSIYVVLNMRIMTTMGKAVLKKLGTKGKFTTCLHSKAELDINRRLILHFPEDNAIWSVGSGYGGNALLGKKCMALRIASFLGNKEGWMAEHMLITGIQDPKGKVTYVAAAFPSACGKTNLAMLVPPLIFRKKGWKVWTVGDDIAWLRVGKDGHLYAVNPEAGFFGVAPGTNSKTNPNAVASVRKNSIFTNVLLKKDKTVWWEDGDGAIPKEGINWKGDTWKPGLKDEDGKPIRGAHANSRFTAPITQCPSFSKNYYSPKGVKISAIIFGGRHASLSPLVYEARNWEHGVFVGATVSSERTAAQVGKLGEVRRDPMAMGPFCGYNMAHYFQHWFDMGKKIKHHPKIFHVDWFRKNAEGKFLWPGFGENFRVLEWMVKRVRNQVSTKESPIGYIPHKRDINLKGIHLSEENWEELFSISTEAWDKETEGQKQFFSKFGKELPQELEREHRELQNRLDLHSLNHLTNGHSKSSQINS